MSFKNVDLHYSFIKFESLFTTIANGSGTPHLYSKVIFQMTYWNFHKHKAL